MPALMFLHLCLMLKDITKDLGEYRGKKCIPPNWTTEHVSVELLWRLFITAWCQEGSIDFTVHTDTQRDYYYYLPVWKMKFSAALFASIVLGSGADAFTAGVRRSARVSSVSLRETISEELGTPCEDECALESFPNLPPSVHPGVVTGQAMLDLLNHAKENGYAIPAVNCVSSSGINACLEAARKNDAPIIIQFSSGGSQVSLWCNAFTLFSLCVMIFN